MLIYHYHSNKLLIIMLVYMKIVNHEFQYVLMSLIDRVKYYMKFSIAFHQLLLIVALIFRPQDFGEVTVLYVSWGKLSSWISDIWSFMHSLFSLFRHCRFCELLNVRKQMTNKKLLLATLFTCCDCLQIEYIKNNAGVIIVVIGHKILTGFNIAILTL